MTLVNICNCAESVGKLEACIATAESGPGGMATCMSENDGGGPHHHGRVWAGWKGHPQSGTGWWSESGGQQRNRCHRCDYAVQGHVAVLIVRRRLHFCLWAEMLTVFFKDRWLLIDFLSIGWLIANFLIPLWLVNGNSVKVICRIWFVRLCGFSWFRVLGGLVGFRSSHGVLWTRNLTKCLLLTDFRCGLATGLGRILPVTP